MKTHPINRIVSICMGTNARNETSYLKVFWYFICILRGDMFPNILGNYYTITAYDLNHRFIGGDKIKPKHLGDKIFAVTDGHHRATAQRLANRLTKKYTNIETDIDYELF